MTKALVGFVPPESGPSGWDHSAILTHQQSSLRSRSPATEQRQLECLEVAVQVRETDLAQPAALVVHWGKEVRRLVPAVIILPRDLFPGLTAAGPGVEFAERIDKVLVKAH